MTVVENKRGRGRPRAFERDAVLERAMQVFWSNGYEGASIPMLTAAMGISAQSLYAAFGSKDALYTEAIGFYRSTIGGFAVRALAEEADAIDAVIRLLRDAATIFARTTGTPGCMIATPSVGPAGSALAALGRELRRDGIDKIAARLERGVNERQVRGDADRYAWSRYVGTVVQGMSIQALDGAPQSSLCSTAEIAIEALQSLRP